MFGMPGGGYPILSSGGGSGPAPSELNSNYSLELGGGETSTSGYMNAQHPADSNFDQTTDSFTISAWVNPGVDDAQQHILSSAYMNVADGEGIRALIGVNNDGTWYCLVGGGENTSGGEVEIGVWKLITLTVQAGFAKLYENGTQVGSTFAVGDADLTATDLDWLIGASRFDDDTDDSYQFSGNICGVTIWDIALNATQVGILYNGGDPIDATTHPNAANLLHYYPITAEEATEESDASADFPVASDWVDAIDATANKTWGIRLSGTSPSYEPTTLSPLPDTFDPSQDPGPLLAIADNYSGSGNWTVDSGQTATLIGSVTKQATSQFAGRSEILIDGDGWFRLADSTEWNIFDFGTQTYVIRMKTGSLNGTGGFFFGYDRTGVDGKPDFKIYNFFYDKDASARINFVDGSTTWLQAESHNSKHTNKYITIHLVLGLGPSFEYLKVYVNGALLVEDNTPSGSPSWDSGQASPLGIGGVAYPTSGGAVSTADGQAIMEVAKYNTEMSAEEIAVQTAEFNALKGYF